MSVSLNQFLSKYYYNKSFYQFGLICIFLLGFVRLVTLGFPGLVDPSDARYTVIAEYMVRSGDWISIKAFESGKLVPYWSKPPLMFWMMAISQGIFGFSAWAARFPSFLATFGTALLILYFSKKHITESVAVFASTLFLSSALIFAFSGAAMLDPLLTFFVTATIMQFYELLFTGSSKVFLLKIPIHRWNIIGILCALGFLTKGPLALFFPVITVLVWLLFTKQIHILFSSVIVSATLLFFIIVAPWFYLHELANPGFLKYFILEENLSRFSSSSDQLLNGSFHPTPRGISLLYFLVCMLPGLFYVFFIPKEQCKHIWNHQRPLFLVLISWTLLPVLFLAFGKQVLIYYLLPVLPAGMIFVSWLLSTSNKKYLLLNLLFGIIFSLVTVFSANSIENRKSTKILFAELMNKNLIQNHEIFFFSNVPDSAYHYARWALDETDGLIKPQLKVATEQNLPTLKQGIVVCRVRHDEKVRQILNINPTYIYGKWRVFLLG
jgi:4-amino-4-deoxy-L-arabinose transferase-like glycosyltransferase